MWSVAARLLCPWNFPGKNTGVGYHFLFWGIFLTQRLNSGLLHWQADALPLSHQGSPAVRVIRINEGLLLGRGKSKQKAEGDIDVEEKVECCFRIDRLSSKLGTGLDEGC